MTRRALAVLVAAWLAPALVVAGGGLAHQSDDKPVTHAVQANATP